MNGMEMPRSRGAITMVRWCRIAGGVAWRKGRIVRVPAVGVVPANVRSSRIDCKSSDRTIIRLYITPRVGAPTFDPCRDATCEGEAVTGGMRRVAAVYTRDKRRVAGGENDAGPRTGTARTRGLRNALLIPETIDLFGRRSPVSTLSPALSRSSRCVGGMSRPRDSNTAIRRIVSAPNRKRSYGRRRDEAAPAMPIRSVRRADTGVGGGSLSDGGGKISSAGGAPLVAFQRKWPYRWASEVESRSEAHRQRRADHWISSEIRRSLSPPGRMS